MKSYSNTMPENVLSGGPLWIFHSILFIVSVSPLFLGSNRPLSWSLLSFFTGLLLIFWLISLIFGNYSLTPQFIKIKFSFWMFAAIIAWIIFQNSGLTPASLHNIAWKDISNILDIPVSGSITVNPYNSNTALMRLLTYGVIFFLSFQYSRRSRNARLALNVTLFAGLFYALLGLYLYFTNYHFSSPLLKDLSHNGDLRSTFINRNHYTCYTSIILIISLAKLFDVTSSKIENHRISTGYFFGAITNIFQTGWFYLLLSITVFSSILLTHSRGGFISVTIACAILFSIFISNAKNNKAPIMISSITAFLCCIFFISISGEDTSQRLRSTSIENSRMNVYSATINGIADSPILGKGFGTYAESFPKYRDSETNLFFAKAHNTYLETAFELGIPALILILLLLGSLLAICIMAIKKERRNIIYPAIGIASTVLIAVHSLVDFSVQIPAIASLYSMLLGTAVAQSLKHKKTV